MSHYLVYVPQRHVQAAQKRDLTQSPLAHVGLPDHAAGAFNLLCGDGPDGQGGTLYSWAPGTAQHRLHYNADEQDWIPAVPHHDQPAERYWIGFWRDSPVTPRDLQRPRLAPGVELELGPDGHHWRVLTSSTLPTEADLTPGGEWVTRVQPQYADYCSEILTWRNTLDSGLREYSLPDLYELTLRVLSINYRLTREVIVRLRLLRDEDIWAVLFAATGRTLQEAGANG